MFDRSWRYYLGFDRIPRERRMGDHGRAILKKWEIREPNNQRWKKNEPTNDQLISTTGYESPWSTNGDTDRLPGISGGDAGLRFRDRAIIGRGWRTPPILGTEENRRQRQAERYRAGSLHPRLRRGQTLQPIL